MSLIKTTSFLFHRSSIMFILFSKLYSRLEYGELGWINVKIVDKVVGSFMMSLKSIKTNTSSSTMRSKSKS